jgi:N-acetylmuramoyl-L-alanine amidase CwlA
MQKEEIEMAIISTGMVNWTVNGMNVNTKIQSSPRNYNNRDSRDIKYVVMHYTGNEEDTDEANAKYFANGSRGASAHFFVDDNSIHQSVELRDIAWHCGASSYKHKTCRNSNSIGIEMCCTAGNYKISTKTQKNAAYLCARNCELLGIKASQVDKYVLRHYDVTGKKCPAQYATNSKEWKQFKTWVKNILKYGDIAKPKTTTTVIPVIDKEVAPTVAKPTLRVGSNGTQVKNLQKDLNYLGFKGVAGMKLTVDGDFGNNTKVALLAFQKKYGLTQDAIYGNMSYVEMKKRLK